MCLEFGVIIVYLGEYYVYVEYDVVGVWGKYFVKGWLFVFVEFDICWCYFVLG